MIENADYSEAELARRKKDVVEYRNKKRNSTIFTFCATVFEIAISFGMFFLLFIITAKILSMTMGSSNPNFGTILLYCAIGLLIVSIIAGFKIYKFTCRKIIKKYNLQEKLLDSVLYHYKTKAELREEIDSGLKI